MKLKAIAAAAGGSTPGGGMWFHRECKRTLYKLNGAGATFPAPYYNACWILSLAQDTGNQVNYQAVGSGAGVRQFTAKDC